MTRLFVHSETNLNISDQHKVSNERCKFKKRFEHFSEY